jgi:hypothetical protein
MAWFIIILSLLWDPITPWLTEPENIRSPFHIRDTSIVVQGRIVGADSYSMGNRIFWTMVLPFVPFILMLFGHETWRRICPLSLVSQIPRTHGWGPNTKKLNRVTGQIERAVKLLPSQSWLRRNHLYFQFGFLVCGLLGRTLLYNSDRVALFAAFSFIIAFAFVVGMIYGGKTWCNYFCPTAVIQSIYTGPGGLFDSKAHITRLPVSQSMCRISGANGDRGACVGCMTNCPDIDLENSYWKSVESDQKRFVYYGFFGLVFAFYTYYYVYAGDWTYYMSGVWTHESGQLAKLLGPGVFWGGTGAYVPKLIAAPIYFFTCIAVSFWLFLLAETVYARIMVWWSGAGLPRAELRHQMLTVSAFLSFNLFYLFAGRPNIFLMPDWAIKVIDILILFVSIAWLFKSLVRNADAYGREYLANTLRAQLARMGFRSEEVLEGKPLEKLSADEIYVLTKTLPDFSVGQKRDAYRAILAEAIETGQTKYAESLKLLGGVRAQLGLLDIDHEAIAETLGIQDPTLFDFSAARSREHRVRRDNYKEFLLGLVQQGLREGAPPVTHLANARSLETAKPVRALLSISDEDHARIVAEITRDNIQLVNHGQGLLSVLRQLEAVRFALNLDKRQESLLINHAIVSRQKRLVREIISLAISTGDQPTANAFAQTIDIVVSEKARSALTDAIASAPESIRATLEQTTEPEAVDWSYFDVLAASKPADDIFIDFATDHDSIVAAVAISALADSNSVNTDRMATGLLERECALPHFVQDVLANARWGERSSSVAIIAELLTAKVFAALELSTLAQIAENSKLVTFSAGAQICRKGDAPDSIFVLTSGKTITWIDEAGERIILGHSAASTVFGEPGVITGSPRSASIEVTTPTATAVEIPRQVIDKIFNRDIQAARGILNVVSGYPLDTISADDEEPLLALDSEAA